MIKKVMGCDPGVAGAIVVLDESGKIIGAHNMPTFDIIKPRAKKKVKEGAKQPKKQSDVTKSKQIDFRALFDVIGGHFSNGDKPEIYIEEITHLFGLPSSSNFKLGYAAGVLQAAVQTYAEEYYQVPARKWQAGVWIESDKELKANGRVDTFKTSQNAFKRIFPDYDGINSEGVRDAALIAYFGLKGGL